MEFGRFVVGLLGQGPQQHNHVYINMDERRAYSSGSSSSSNTYLLELVSCIAAAVLGVVLLRYCNILPFASSTTRALGNQPVHNSNPTPNGSDATSPASSNPSSSASNAAAAAAIPVDPFTDLLDVSWTPRRIEQCHTFRKNGQAGRGFKAYWTKARRTVNGVEEETERWQKHMDIKDDDRFREVLGAFARASRG